MRLITQFLTDKYGLVMAFTALILPLLLLLGVMGLQSGQLYVRQAQLQFLARQTANSALIPVSEMIEKKAKSNWSELCLVELPPVICSSNRWFDFISDTELAVLLKAKSTYLAVEAELQQFALENDPAQKLQPETIQFDFPVLDAVGRASLRVEFIETQDSWIGNVLRADDYQIRVESLSYLSQT